MGRRQQRDQGSIAGYLLTCRLPTTNETLEIPVEKGFDTAVAIAPHVKEWPKYPHELKKGELIPAWLEVIDATLEELEELISKSPDYFSSKKAVYLCNREGMYTPRVRYQLIAGLLKQPALSGKISQESLDKKLLQEGMDFSDEEYESMAAFLYKFLQEHCETYNQANPEHPVHCVTQQTIKKFYLGGKSVFPKFWQYFSFFTELNPEFKEYADGFDISFTEEDERQVRTTTIRSGTIMEQYHTFVTKRRLLMRFLGLVKEEVVDDAANRREWEQSKVKEKLYRKDATPVDIVPELRLLYEHKIGKREHYVYMVVEKAEPLRMAEFEQKRREYHGRVKRKVKVLENKEPRPEGIGTFNEYPLCCVNSLVNDLFKYTLLVAFRESFREKRLPDHYVNDLSKLILHLDGVRNAVTDAVYRRFKPEEHAILRRTTGDYDIVDLLPLGEHALRSISTGDIAQAVGVPSAAYLSFYHILRNITNALPNKLWDLQVKLYENNQPWKRVTMTLEVAPEDRGNPAAILKATEKARAEFREQAMTKALTEVRQEREHIGQEVQRLELQIYKKPHQSMMLPMAFVLDPFPISNFYQQSLDHLPMLEIINDHEAMGDLTAFLLDRVWKRRSSVNAGGRRFRRNECQAIFAYMGIPEMAAVIPETNFLSEGIILGESA